MPASSGVQGAVLLQMLSSIREDNRAYRRGLPGPGRAAETLLGRVGCFVTIHFAAFLLEFADLLSRVF